MKTENWLKINGKLAITDHKNRIESREIMSDCGNMGETTEQMKNENAIIGEALYIVTKYCFADRHKSNVYFDQMTYIFGVICLEIVHEMILSNLCA